MDCGAAYRAEFPRESERAVPLGGLRQIADRAADGSDDPAARELAALVARAAELD